MKTIYPIILPILVIISVSACHGPSELSAVKATNTDVELTITSVTSGTVEAEKEAQLAFGAVGRVAELTVKEGSQVVKGQILAQIENQDLKSALEQSEQDLKRTISLRNSSVVPPQELEHARENVDRARGAYEKSIIRAPFDGMIAEINLEIGQLSQITTINPKALLRIVDTAPRFVSTDIDEVDLPRIRAGLPARIKVLAVRREPFNGSVRHVIPFVSAVREQDRTSRVELTLDSEGLMMPPGASADVEIIAEKRVHVLALPSRAVLGRGNERFVFTVKEGKTQKVPIKIGIGNYEKSEILEGINSGDIVLMPSDNVALSDGIAVSAKVLPWP